MDPHNWKEEAFEVVHELWNEYRLPNGDCVRVKTVVSKVFRVLDSDGRPLTEKGEPNIQIRHTVIATATAAADTPVSDREQVH